MRLAGLVGLVIVLLFGWVMFSEEALVFHPIQIADMVKEQPAEWHKMRTHIAVTGFVTYEKQEADGDTHIRLCDSTQVRGMDHDHCVVAEIIPAIPQAHPKKGDHITVQGISRYDAENPGHHWWEVHPVISWQGVK